MKNVLVTGGAGFIGSNFVHYLLNKDQDIQIVNIDLLTYSGSKENLKNLPDPNRHTFVHSDIRDESLVLDLISKHSIDTIIHFAAESHVDRSILDPSSFIDTNIVGTYTLLEAARKSWLQDGKRKAENVRFHHISTDEVYGTLTPDEPAFTELTSYKPNSPYAASKASSDHLVRAYYHTYGLPVTITNCSNNYGPFQFPEKMIALMTLNAAQGKKLPVYGDGMQIRDWLYVEDHCEAIELVIRKGKTGEVYNVGGNNQITNIDIVKHICDVLDDRLADEISPRERLIEYVKDRPGHDRRYAVDISKISSELGWSPKIQFEEGLARTIDWYLGNQEWVDAISDRGDYQSWISTNYSSRNNKG